MKTFLQYIKDVVAPGAWMNLALIFLLKLLMDGQVVKLITFLVELYLEWFSFIPDENLRSWVALAYLILGFVSFGVYIHREAGKEEVQCENM